MRGHPPPKKIGILLRDEEQQYPLDQVKAVCTMHGIDTCLLDEGEDGQDPDDLDVAIAMGGDGTVLKALRRLPQVPVLAINFGKVGFLTAGDRKDFAAIISRLVQGDYFISERLRLSCRYPGGNKIPAINEVIIRAHNRLVFTDVFVDDTKIRTIRGDGVIVGTATGSTGTLLSTGAPIVMPGVRCIILDGINEYNFTSRALIISPESHVRLYISPETRDGHVYLMADGTELGELLPGQQVEIIRSSYNAKLIYFESNYFFQNLSSKLSWD